jgi:hypothetical protein
MSLLKVLIFALQALSQFHQDHESFMLRTFFSELTMLVYGKNAKKLVENY